MLADTIQSMGAVLGVLAPLIAVPLTLITFYLRSLREHQIVCHAQLERRLEAFESELAELRRGLTERDRDFATKEEWLRECMYTRRLLDELRENAARSFGSKEFARNLREPRSE